MDKPALLTSRFAQALQLAFDLHRRQARKGSGVPYVSHLLSVAALVLEDGGDEEEAIAALLHDAVEDHAERITLQDIRDRFGGRVAAIVAGCTDTPEDYRGGEKPAWESRKRSYIEHIRRGGADQRVALADKLHNGRSIVADLERDGAGVWDRFTATPAQTLWYYRSVAEAFRQAGVRGRMLDELDRTVREMERLAGPQAPAG